MPNPEEIWDSPERAAILRRSGDRDEESSREETEALLEGATLSPGMRVLDLACGAGIPTLDVARRVGPKGTVVGVDLSSRVLEVARERAARAKIRNTEFQTANIEQLPFPDSSFDRVVCRFGAMFLEDPLRGAREIFRVLRPTGRVSLMVWGSFEQPYWQGTVGVLARHLELTELPSEAQRPFRFAEPGSLEVHLSNAGFVQVNGQDRVVHWIRHLSPEQARDEWRDGLVFWRALADGLPGGSDSPAWDEIAEWFRGYHDGTTVRAPLFVRVIVGTRPGT
jgi:SAM-dependent methyltransferase